MLRILSAFTLTALAGAALAQPAKPPLEFRYGHDLKVRNVGEKNFTATTPKVGVEFFKDPVTNALVAISEAGHLAVVPFAAAAGDSKKAEWLAAYELNVRDAAVESFKDSKKVAAETFKDQGSGKLFTISGQKTIAFADAPGTPPSDAEPTWHHALKLKVRPAGEKDYAAAKTFGVEAFKDATLGGLIYLTDQGFIACAPAPTKAPEADAVKPPRAVTGLTLNARKADEGDFTDKTKAYGIEVYTDPNSGATLYLSETGSLAAAVLPEAKKGQGVRWSHSFAVKARKAGEKWDNAMKYGVEVFEDKNTGAMIYICENGSIAVLKK